MKGPALSACLLVVFAFGSFHGKGAAFLKDSSVSKTLQMLRAASMYCPKINKCALDAREYGVLKKQERFCEIMERRAEFENCATRNGGECTERNIDRLYRLACDEESRFEKVVYAIVVTSNDCQSAMRKCELPPQNEQLYSGNKICDLFNETLTEECAITEGCTRPEYTKVLDIACGACGFTATVMVVTLSLMVTDVLIR